MTRPLTLARCAAVLALLGGSYAIADHESGADTEIAFAISDDLIETLSGVDFVPLKSDFDELLGATALDDLISIARDEGRDSGVRIRAYRALSHYPDPRTEAALAQAIQDHSTDGMVALASTGVDTILLRAAMGSFAVIAQARAVSHIAPMLHHQSRDVRAAAAHALAVTNSLSAVPLLRERGPLETVPQVVWALEEAIRDLLGEGPTVP